ncbi:major facilitator superfamily transporter domain-containing protein 1 [Salpingoeca rosetta]|uniref:Lysosomal dipeptide transporter MFSD1 n=1 Tax=Salpingoeca rosetta (strain ATCC 50818 / BSB-021) TaxID=946362 RepID=F2U7E6_SALR5|nr:major facilitator superfamily transporter domain-containing protein 1 [Salpingoeca rosetta]EGD83363.1 major facilitator superfamily transporter domain-containing protein 1 [Salpingoeca rosetta]|eukprot:XP_004994867.1 major facilitator superfamily transporter domain-containing protein 1 [Salpingoeca rosetta]
MLEANTLGYRLLVLLFNCLLTFGSYYCFDMPSVLETTFEDSKEDGGLGLTSVQYNLLYSIYAWTNAAMVIGAGFLVDKAGNRLSLLLFSGLCLVGASIFALGVSLKLYPLMLCGRLIFGSGNGSLTIVQNKITAMWFEGKELAMAFGFTLAFSRLGSVLNFLFTETISDHLGLSNTLWFGCGLCGLGFLSALTVSYLDSAGQRKLGKAGDLKSASKKVKFTDIRFFDSRFWLLALTIMFFYNSVFPFVADAASFVHMKYDKSKTASSHIAGGVYYVSMGLSPFMGALVDRLGGRGYLSIACSILTIPVFVILAFVGKSVSPYVPVLGLGVTYSIMAAVLWPSIPLVVTPATVGTAMGVVTSLQMIGIGLCNLCVGWLRGKYTKDSTPEEVHQNLEHWKHVMLFLLAQIVACVAVSVVLNIVDARTGRVLNRKGMSKGDSDEDDDEKRALPAPGDEEVVEDNWHGRNETSPLLASRDSPKIN